MKFVKKSKKNSENSDEDLFKKMEAMNVTKLYNCTYIHTYIHTYIYIQKRAYLCIKYISDAT